MIEPGTIADILRDCLNLCHDLRTEVKTSSISPDIEAFNVFQMRFFVTILHSFGSSLTSLPNNITEAMSKMLDKVTSSVSSGYPFLILILAL